MARGWVDVHHLGCAARPLLDNKSRMAGNPGEAQACKLWTHWPRCSSSCDVPCCLHCLGLLQSLGLEVGSGHSPSNVWTAWRRFAGGTGESARRSARQPRGVWRSLPADRRASVHGGVAECLGSGHRGIWPTEYSRNDAQLQAGTWGGEPNCASYVASDSLVGGWPGTALRSWVSRVDSTKRVSLLSVLTP